MLPLPLMPAQSVPATVAQPPRNEVGVLVVLMFPVVEDPGVKSTVPPRAARDGAQEKAGAAGVAVGGDDHGRAARQDGGAVESLRGAAAAGGFVQGQRAASQLQRVIRIEQVRLRGGVAQVDRETCRRRRQSTGTVPLAGPAKS